MDNDTVAAENADSVAHQLRLLQQRMARALAAAAGSNKRARESQRRHNRQPLDHAWASGGTSRLTYRAPKCLLKGTEEYIQPCRNFDFGKKDQKKKAKRNKDAAESASTNQDDDDDVTEECPICFCAYDAKHPPVVLVTCSHRYHKECLREALKRSPKCPTCRQDVIEPQGRSPSGTMTISKINDDCTGYEGHGTIVIDYNVSGGTQREYHENPGVSYQSTYRQAYLPDTAEGRDTLKRLQYAWLHGLTFSVGTSLTTGATNVVTWSSIHHKTSRWGGPHGFPDPNFFLNCNEELDCLGVPAAVDLE